MEWPNCGEGPEAARPFIRARRGSTISTMARGGGKRIAVVAVGLGVLAIAGAGTAFRGLIEEEWLIRKLAARPGAEEAGEIAAELSQGHARARRAAEDWYVLQLGREANAGSIEALSTIGTPRAL